MSTTKVKLVRTAFDLFGRGGFHGVGLDQIIEAVGISKQTFYNHFESKDDLVLAVLDYRHEMEMEMFGQMLRRLAGDDPRAQLYAVFDALDAWYNEPEWRGCIFMTAAAEFPVKSEPAHQAATKHLVETQEKLQYLATLAGAKDPKKLAEELQLLIEGVVAYRHITGNNGCTDIVKRVARHMLDEQLARQAVPA